MPEDPETWRRVVRGLDEAAGAPGFAAAPLARQQEIVGRFAAADLHGGTWATLDVGRAWSVVMRAVLAAFYSHPWAWSEIGFGGPAYPRGAMRMQIGPAGREPHERPEAFGPDPVRDLDGRSEG
jgi:hypothetical protein